MISKLPFQFQSDFIREKLESMSRDKVENKIQNHAFKSNHLVLTVFATMAAFVLGRVSNMNSAKVKRSLSMDEVPTGAVKKAKMKGKASETFKNVLNFLHITERKKTGLPKAVKSSTWNDPEISMSIMPDVATAGEPRFSIAPLKGQRVRTGLSKSWSYFVHDPFDELSDVEDDDKEGNVFFNESYFEDDYCQDYRNVTDEEIVSPKNTFLTGIKMGVSSLSNRSIFDKNEDSLFSDSVKTPYGIFSRNSVTRKASRRKHASLPDVREKSLTEPKASVEKDIVKATDESIDEIMAQFDACNCNLGLNIVFDASVLNDSNGNCDIMTVDNHRRVSNMDVCGQVLCQDKIHNSDMSVSYSKVEMVDVSASSSNQNVNDVSSDIEMVAASPRTPKHRDRALYRDKRPVPLNITLTSTPNKKKCSERISPDLAVSSDCTSDINAGMSPSEESDSLEDVFPSKKGHIILGKSRKEANSFPSSPECESKTISSSSRAEQRQPSTKRYSTKRYSTESGYDSCGRPSSTPGTPLDQNQIGREIDQSSVLATPTAPKKSVLSLSALGTVSSEALLNKMDGFLSPPRCARRCLSPRFKFPRSTSPKGLKTVLEISEPSSDRQEKISTHSYPVISSISEVKYSPKLGGLSLKKDANEKELATPDCIDASSKSFFRDIISSVSHSKKDSKICNVIFPINKISETQPVRVKEYESCGAPENVDKNNNIDSAARIVEQEPETIVLQDNFNVPVTPVNKIPTPISTSSPLLEPIKQRCNSNHDILQSNGNVSPVRWKSSPNSKTASSRNKQRRKRRDLSVARFKLSPKSPLFDINNNAGGYKNQSSDEEIEVISPCSKDYLVLKRAADSLVRRIQPNGERKELINMVRLVEYLNTFYLSEISKLYNKKIQTVSEFRTFKQEFCEIFTPDRLNINNCISELLIMALVKPVYIAPCADFIFENLHYVVYGCPEFLQAPPELTLLLLSNTRRVVFGPHGFPLAHKDSEHEVFRAVVKYLEHRKTTNDEADKNVKKMLLSVIDPRFHAKDSTQYRKKRSPPSCNLEKDKFAKRPYHEIKYHRSDTFVTTPDTRQEYLFQPFLSSAISSYPKTEEESVPGAERKCNDEVMGVCDSAHTLRKLYFSYRRHNKVPYITSIGLQYANKGQKKMYTVGAPGEQPLGPENHKASIKEKDTRNFGRHSPNSTPGTSKSFTQIQSPPTPTTSIGTNTANDSSFLTTGCRDSQTKLTAIKLAPGEHVTGVSLQGDAVLHNVEITTNKGRHIRAHRFSDTPGSAPWTSIPTPEGGALTPYCLQALYADVKKPSSRAYLRDIEAVWAVLSRPLNDLSA